jgi:hypothetical protein
MKRFLFSLLAILVFILFSCNNDLMENANNSAKDTGTPPSLENVTYNLKGFIPAPNTFPHFSEGSIIEIRFVVTDPDMDAEKLVIHYDKIEDAVYDLSPQAQESQDYLVEVPYIDTYTSGSSYITIVDEQGNVSDRHAYQTAAR